MTTEDRLKLLKPLVTFGKDEFIVTRVLQRRKDNLDLEYSVKQLKTYSFYSWEELEEQLSRIKEICDLNNARAYIRLNKQNSVDVSLRCISEMTDNIRNGNPHKNKGVWDSVCGKGGNKDWWVVDLDKEHLEFNPENKFGYNLKGSLIQDLTTHYLTRLTKEEDITINFETYEGVFKIERVPVCFIKENPTKSGIHLVVKPFDTRILEKYNKELSSKGIPLINLQKDANSILYIGNQNK